MRIVRFNQAVKTDDPHFIVADQNATVGLSDEAAEFAVRQGWAEDTGHVPVVKTEPLIPEERKVIDPRDLLGPEGQKEADEAAEEKKPPKRPYGNAPKSAWVDYAVAIDPDTTAERAESMSKADLMSRYGERLL